MIRNPALALLLCGFSALYWELVLIRWVSTCVRVVAYYSNFVLISAFFGLGVGALLARRKARLDVAIFPVLTACVLIALALAGFRHLNPQSDVEHVWIGGPTGIASGEGPMLSLSIVLPLVYLSSAAVFVVFGQWIGRLFQQLPPLKAYSIEIFGSLLGIATFAVLSALRLGPTVWFAVGVVVLLLIVRRHPLDYLLAAGSVVPLFVFTVPFVQRYTGHAGQRRRARLLRGDQAPFRLGRLRLFG